MNRRVLPVVAALSSLLALGGCAPDNPPSTSMADLARQVTTDIPATAVTWQIFGTPEYTGGVPGPTDYITLIAEFRGVPAQWIARRDEPVGRTWIAPEAPRPWLAPGFRQLLAGAQGNVVDLIDRPHCHPHTGYVRKSGRPVQGFACAEGNAVLLYLTLSEPAGAE